MTLPSESRIRDIVRRTAEIHFRLGSELGERPLVLPNGKFFPDRYTGDAASALTLLRRMQGHAGMTDIPLELRIIGGAAAPIAGTEVDTGVSATDGTREHEHQCCGGSCSGENSGASAKSEGSCKGCDGQCKHEGGTCACRSKPPEARPASNASCSSGGCGSGCGVPTDVMGNAPRLVDLGQGWRVQIPEAELSHPVALTTNLARTLGVVFLAETTSPKEPLEGPIEVSAEIAATLLGLGSLLLAGSYVYSKSCGGPRIAQLTTLAPGELALATVLFATRRGHDFRTLVREMDATQRDALSKAREWFDERPKLVERFLRSPESLARGDIPMSPSRVGLLARWFGKKGPTTPDIDALDIDELEAELSRSGAPRTQRSRLAPNPDADELRALVDEALASSGSAK